jgi:hypothetical protein
MLLGFIIAEHGIEANLEKISAITNMASIQNLKGVQRLMGCLASLSHFISCLDEKGLPLYCLLKKTEHFSWTPEAQEALDKLKALLSKAPILVPPQKKNPSCYTSWQPTRWLARPPSLSDKRRSMHSRSNDQSISSVRFCPKPRYGIHKSRNYSTPWSWLGESYDTTLNVVTSFPLGEVVQN